MEAITDYLLKAVEGDDIGQQLVKNIEEMERRKQAGELMSCVEYFRPTQMLYNYVMCKLGGQINEQQKDKE